MFSTKIKRPFFTIGEAGDLRRETLELTVTILNGEGDIGLVRKIAHGKTTILKWGVEELCRIYNMREIFDEAVEAFEKVDRNIEMAPSNHLRRVK